MGCRKNIRDYLASAAGYFSARLVAQLEIGYCPPVLPPHTVTVYNRAIMRVDESSRCRHYRSQAARTSVLLIQSPSMGDRYGRHYQVQILRALSLTVM